MMSASTEPPASPVHAFWFCHQCFKLIRPVGTPGVLDATGNHYCSSCPPAEFKATDSRRSSTSRSRSVTAAGALTEGAAAAPELPAGLAPAPRRYLLHVVGGVLVAGLLGVALWQLLSTGSSVTDMHEVTDEGGDQQPAPTPPEPEPKETVAPEPSAPEKTKEEPAAPVSTQGPVAEPEKKQEASPEPVPALPVPVPPEKLEPPAKVEAPAKKDEPQKAAPPPPPQITEEEFQNGLKAAAALGEPSRFSAALKQFDELRAKASAAPWWDQQIRPYHEALGHVQKLLNEYQTEAQDILRQVTENTQPAFFDAAEKAWKPKAELADELASEPAKMILRAVVDGRARVVVEARARELADIEKKFEQYEALVKSDAVTRSTAPAKLLEPAFKFAADIEKRFLDDRELAEKTVERLEGLQFDLAIARDGPMAFSRAAVKKIGAGAEVHYDFAGAQQFRAWTYDRPAKGDADTNATCDPARQAVVMKAQGEDHWSVKERKDAGFMRVPFVFRPEIWVFAAEMTELNPKDAKTPPEYGLVVSDDKCKSYLRFVFRDVAQRGASRELVFVALSTPEKGDKDAVKDVARLPAKRGDTIRLSMTFQQNHLNFVVAAKNAVAPSNLRLQIPFQVKLLGLCLLNHDKDVASAVAFDNVKLTGIPDLDEARKQATAARTAVVAAAKRELNQHLTSAHLARDQGAGLINPDWAKEWKFVGPSPNAKSSQLDANGRQKVWATDARDGKGKPSGWVRQLTLPAGKPNSLRLEVSATRQKNWNLIVKVNDEQKLKQLISGEHWVAVEVPLATYAGQATKLEMFYAPANANDHDQNGYWDRVRVSAP